MTGVSFLKCESKQPHLMKWSVPQVTVICTIVGEWGTLIQQPSSPILIHHNQSWKAETIVCKWVSTKGQNPKHGGSSWTLTITHYFLTITDSNWDAIWLLSQQTQNQQLHFSTVFSTVYHAKHFTHHEYLAD
jgi:hypothetical protein